MKAFRLKLKLGVQGVTPPSAGDRMWGYNLSVREAATERKKRDGSKRQRRTVNSVRKMVGTGRTWTCPHLILPAMQWIDWISKTPWDFVVSPFYRWQRRERTHTTPHPSPRLLLPASLKTLKSHLHLWRTWHVAAAAAAVDDSSIHLFFKRGRGKKRRRSCLVVGGLLCLCQTV